MKFKLTIELDDDSIIHENNFIKNALKQTAENVSGSKGKVTCYGYECGKWEIK